MKHKFIKTRQRFYNKGFTLVELLVVISLVGILAGVTISIINPVKQRQVAEDGVKQSNLQKFALGVEAYGNANSKYPDEAGGKPNPTTDPDVGQFIKQYPDGEPAGSTYTYYNDSTNGTFSIVVMKSEVTTACFKYHSSWGKIQSCTGSNCNDGTTGC